MTVVHITIGLLSFDARMEETDAPETCNVIRQIIPLHARTVQALWCGEATWIPLPNQITMLPRENATSIPNRGEILFYAEQSGVSGLLIPYGNAHFGSAQGERLGNHCLTIISGNNHFQALGNKVLWDGAQSVHIEL